MKRILFLLGAVVTLSLHAQTKNPAQSLQVPEPQVYRGYSTEPSEIREEKDKFIAVYEDTVRTVKCKEVKVLVGQTEPEVVAPTIKGHYIQAQLGAGFGSLGYRLKQDGERVGSNQGDLQGLLQVQYLYMFNDHWGIKAGLGLSGYGSYGQLNHTFKNWNGVSDSEGKTYDHWADVRGWKEHQITHIAEIPVGVQYQHALTEQLQMYAGLGVRVGIPIYSKWSLQKGEVEHEGYYPWLGNQEAVRNVHEFRTEDAESFDAKDQKDLHLKKVALAVDLDWGLLIPLNRRLDLMAGVYAQVNCLDLKDGSEAIGWAQTDAQGVKNRGFMNTYQGEVNSDLTQKVLPWGVGVKVGIRWHAVKKPKAPEPIYENRIECDTTIDLTQHYDTTMKLKREEVVQRIQTMMKKAVIWFDVNSTEPKLEPADILDQVAAALKLNREQKVIISGNASKEGNQEKNRVLAEKRAQVIADQLVEKGVLPEQLQVEAHAADIEYKVEEGQVHTIALDRRTEIIPITE